MNRIKGVMAVVPTPLIENEDADIESIERLIEFLASQGLSLFALGSAGEGMNLTFSTRVAVARKMAEVNDGRVPLLGGGGGFSVKASLEFIDAIADCKVDGVHIIPYDGKISGTRMLYEGLCRFLQQQPGRSVYDYVPGEYNLCVDLSYAGKARTALDIVRKVYSVRDDDVALRSVLKMPAQERGKAGLHAVQ